MTMTPPPEVQRPRPTRGLTRSSYSRHSPSRRASHAQSSSSSAMPTLMRCPSSKAFSRQTTLTSRGGTSWAGHGGSSPSAHKKGTRTRTSGWAAKTRTGVRRSGRIWRGTRGIVWKPVRRWVVSLSFFLPLVDAVRSFIVACFPRTP